MTGAIIGLAAQWLGKSDAYKSLAANPTVGKYGIGLPLALVGYLMRHGRYGAYGRGAMVIGSALVASRAANAGTQVAVFGPDDDVGDDEIMGDDDVGGDDVGDED